MLCVICEMYIYRFGYTVFVLGEFIQLCNKFATTYLVSAPPVNDLSSFLGDSRSYKKLPSLTTRKLGIFVNGGI